MLWPMTTSGATRLPMRELARSTGVSPQTIHFYMRTGLLRPPERTARNMAYYGAEHVEDIRLIKELQSQRYLPLSVIKRILAARREGKDVTALEDMRRSIDDVFRPQDPRAARPIGVAAFRQATGLSAAQVGRLERLGLIRPARSARGARYDDLDVRIGRGLRTLLAMGLRLSELGLYRRYVEILRAEADLVGRAFIRRRTGAGEGRGSDLKAILDDLKAALGTRVYREATAAFMREEVPEKRR